MSMIIENRQLINVNCLRHVSEKRQERRYKDAFKTANWDYDNTDDYCYVSKCGKKIDI